MWIFNNRWKHNNTETKLTVPLRKLKPYPVSLVFLLMISSLAIVYETSSLVLDIIPSLSCLEKDVNMNISRDKFY